jgi:hypothetical protein
MLKKAVVELGIACVRNYIVYSQTWFGISFSEFRIATLPISFDLDQKTVEAAALRSSKEAINFLRYMEEARLFIEKEDSDFEFSVRVNYEIIKNPEGSEVKSENVRENPDYKVSVSGNKLPPGFVWDYSKLIEKVAKLYPGIKINNTFHSHMRVIREDPRFTFVNYNDPLKKKGAKAWFNPNVLNELAMIYGVAREQK